MTLHSQESLFVVSMPILTKIRELHARRDEQAYIAGCAVLGQRTRELEIITQYTKTQERHVRLGALYEEFLNAITQCHRLVEQSMNDEKVLGTRALKEIGLDPNKEELRIDLDGGVVLVLKEGVWIPRERT